MNNTTGSSQLQQLLVCDLAVILSLIASPTPLLFFFLLATLFTVLLVIMREILVVTANTCVTRIYSALRWMIPLSLPSRGIMTSPLRLATREPVPLWTASHSMQLLKKPGVWTRKVYFDMPKMVTNR